MAAGYICTCSELITKLQRTSYAKAQWEDTIILGHYYWRLWQDAEPLICHCTGTVPPENEDVCWGEQSRLQTQPTVTVWPLEQQHPRGHTDTSPPAQGETEAGSPSVPECSPAPEPHKAPPAAELGPRTGRDLPTARGFCVQLMNLFWIHGYY